MTSQPKALYELQKIDLQISHHHRRLKEIIVALEDNAIVRAAQKQVKTAQKALVPLRKKAADLERDIQTNNLKAKGSDQRLYSGTVKNPKELQDLQQEIASLKERNNTLEDRLLEVMIDVEEAEALLAGHEQHLVAITENREQQHRDLLDEQSTLKSAVVILGKQREKAVANVDDDNLTLYDSMKVKKGNQPIAVMKERNCAACGVEQTMTIAQQVQHGTSLVQCFSCGRILVEIR